MAKVRGNSRIPRPAVDDRLVMPETRFEIIEGKLTYVPPAKEPHATRHSKVAALLEAHVTDAYDVAADMLTRASVEGDFAPDVSVFLSARDPETGGRRLEELAFEIADTQTLGEAAKKARLLAQRGVRRIFALDVKVRRALEWSRPTNTWKMLPPTGHIEDPALVTPLSIEMLVALAKADDGMARALLAKRNPVLMEELERKGAEGEARGEAKGVARSILTILEARGIPVSKSEAARIRRTRDNAVLERWLVVALTCKSAKGLR